MKDYFIVSDTHSFYTEMMTALTKEGFDKNNPEHIVIICGDMMDRGTESKEMLDFFYDLFKANRCVMIKGNHEDLFEDMLKYRQWTNVDISNGTVLTLGSLQLGCNLTVMETIIDFDSALYGYDARWDELRANMVDYYEIGKYIFVHGFIPMSEEVGEHGKRIFKYRKDWRKASKEDWKEARWTNGQEMNIYNKIRVPGKTIVCGHWHSSYGNVRDKVKKEKLKNVDYRRMEFSDNGLFKPYYGKGLIAIDACTAYTKYANCLHLTENEIMGVKENETKDNSIKLGDQD